MSRPPRRVILALVDSHLRAEPGTAPFSIGALPVWSRLRDALVNDGYQFCTLDEPLDPSAPTTILWDFASIRTLHGPLSPRSGTEVIAWSLESPLVAHRAFHRIDSIAARASVTLTFPGARSLIDSSRNFTPLHWPVRRRHIDVEPEWRTREEIVMIASHKLMRPTLSAIDPRAFQRSARSLASSLVGASYRFRRTWTAPNLYDARAELALQLARDHDVAIYGPGWDRFTGSADQVGLVHKADRGVAPDKHAVLKKHKFSICFENTRFPGYITEKIFDCFFAGVIPIYLGAPDIGDYIPPGCFVDASRLSAGELHDFLSRFQDRDAQPYLVAARAFVESSAFELFSEESFVTKMLRSIKGVAA